jgi:hypothetical protein
MTRAHTLPLDYPSWALPPAPLRFYAVALARLTMLLLAVPVGYLAGWAFGNLLIVGLP